MWYVCVRACACSYLSDPNRLHAYGFVHVPPQTGVIVSDPAHIRHVMDKNQRNYPKDIELSYKPFLHILGTGLVTSSGESWKRQRKLVSVAFRKDILEETAGVAKRAVDRLSLRLEAKRGTGEPVEVAEEFRVMTLQVRYTPPKISLSSGQRVPIEHGCWSTRSQTSAPCNVGELGDWRAHPLAESRRVCASVPRALPPHCYRGEPASVGTMARLHADTAQLQIPPHCRQAQRVRLRPHP
jgi:hypothetical protein